MLHNESGENEELFRKYIDRKGNTLWFAENIPVSIFLNSEQKTKLYQASKYYSFQAEDECEVVPDKLLVRAIEMACQYGIGNILDYMCQDSRNSFNKLKEKGYEKPISLKWEGQPEDLF